MIWRAMGWMFVQMSGVLAADQASNHIALLTDRHAALLAALLVSLSYDPQKACPCLFPRKSENHDPRRLSRLGVFHLEVRKQEKRSVLRRHSFTVRLGLRHCDVARPIIHRNYEYFARRAAVQSGFKSFFRQAISHQNCQCLHLIISTPTY